MNSLFRPFPGNLTFRLSASFCRPRCSDKEVSLQTVVDNPPGQEAYDALKISRIDLAPKTGYTQSPSHHPCKVCDVLYCIPIFSFGFVSELGSFSRDFHLLRLLLFFSLFVSLPIGNSLSLWLDNRSRMSREVHVRFWQSARVGFPRATQLDKKSAQQRVPSFLHLKKAFSYTPVTKILLFLILFLKN